MPPKPYLSDVDRWHSVLGSRDVATVLARLVDLGVAYGRANSGVDTMPPAAALRAAIVNDNFLPLKIPVRIVQGIAETAAERSFRIGDDLVAAKIVLVRGTGE